MCFNKNNKNTQQYFQEAFDFTLFAVILCPRASSLSSTYSKQFRRACSASLKYSWAINMKNINTI